MGREGPLGGFVKTLNLDQGSLAFADVLDFSLNRDHYRAVTVSAHARERVEASHARLQTLLEQKIPIYGVTTGFGDSCTRPVSLEHSEQLQANLVSYLLCGTGPLLPVEAARATFLVRLNSLSRGYSGVSWELVDRMRLFLENDWVPAIPQEGSLGASGDLIPLAYLAQILQGEGRVYDKGRLRPTAEVLYEKGLMPYRLKPKEGLALVNGTSTMAGLFMVNWSQSQFLVKLASLSTAWLCLVLKGRGEPFGALVNERAKTSPGQGRVAKTVRRLLKEEGHTNKPLTQFREQDGRIEQVQDRYSLRCTPQILGPVFETLDLCKTWLQAEIDSVSDNPLIGDEGELQMGGNFYGGYLSQGTDYLKISLAQIADLIDRQLMSLVDEKSNRGLPPNLAAWNTLPESERFLHHGLKGLHQAVSAITSEILARATPNSIFSRSSESHNQDKVSLGMSASVQCQSMLEPLFTISSMYLICLAQALDLRGIKLQGHDSSFLYSEIRALVPFVSHDQPLEKYVVLVREKMKNWSKNPDFLKEMSL